MQHFREKITVESIKTTTPPLIIREQSIYYKVQIIYVVQCYRSYLRILAVCTFFIENFNCIYVVLIFSLEVWNHHKQRNRQKIIIQSFNYSILCWAETKK